MDVGPWELAIVVIVAVLMFGSKKLPELARGIGEAKREYQRGLAEGLDGPTPATTGAPAIGAPASVEATTVVAPTTEAATVATGTTTTEA